MIRVLIFSLIISSWVIKLNAQNSLYDYIKLGDYQVAYGDTIIFDTNYPYEAFDYAGMKPHFIQIWFPLTVEPQNPVYLRYKDFFEGPKTDRLLTIQKELKKNYRETVIRDYIEENLLTTELNDFGEYSNENILDMMADISTKSIKQNKFNLSEFPVIIYHHGAQSFAFENYAMAEYFASKGFVFIAANFHLPYENKIFGVKPFDKIHKGEEEQSLKTILDFSKTLSKSEYVFFIGHSWGAQMGLRTFDADTSIKAFISLETTIEFKTDLEKIENIWPEVFQKVFTENARYPFPVLFCAATGKKKAFTFFENINAPSRMFVSTKSEFEHDAYVSSFYLRLFLDSKVKQADREILQDRLFLYVKHLELIYEFIDGVHQGKRKPETEVQLLTHN